MLMVTNLSGVTDVVASFNNFEMYEETNGSFTLSFTSISHPENHGHILLEQEGFVEYEGYEFRIKQLRNSPLSKQIKAVSTYFDNVNTRKYDTYGGTHTLDEFATYVFEGTGWTFVNDDVLESAFIPNFGGENIVKLVETLKAAFQCEMKIEPNKVVRFAKQIGPDNDEHYRYGHNIVSISENIDTTKLRTYIEGYGANDIHVTYTSPLASSPGIGIRHAEPIRDDRFTQEDQLLQHIKNELHDYPESSIELDAIELQDKEVGERVWLIHEKIGIEYQTRVMAKRTRIPKHLSTVVLGNVKPQTISSLLSSQKVELDRNKKETISKIEQTDEMIKLEVSRLDGDIAVAQSQIQMNADEITLRVTKTEYDEGISGMDSRVTDAESSILQNADEIALRVTKSVYDTDINGLKTRIGDAESSITQNANEIALKVSQTTYETDINDPETGLKSRVTDAESRITQNADEISLRVTKTTYDTDIGGLDTRVTNAESNITQNANAITSKVSSTVSGAEEIFSLFEQTASNITLKASKIDLLGIVKVAETLSIGNADDLSGTKTLQFRGGTVIIQSPSNAPDDLNIETTLGGINLSASRLFITATSGNQHVYINNNPVLTTADTVTAVWG